MRACSPTASCSRVFSLYMYWCTEVLNTAAQAQAREAARPHRKLAGAGRVPVQGDGAVVAQAGLHDHREGPLLGHCPGGGGGLWAGGVGGRWGLCTPYVRMCVGVHALQWTVGCSVRREGWGSLHGTHVSICEHELKWSVDWKLSAVAYAGRGGGRCGLCTAYKCKAYGRLKMWVGDWRLSVRSCRLSTALGASALGRSCRGSLHGESARRKWMVSRAGRGACLKTSCRACQLLLGDIWPGSS